MSAEEVVFGLIVATRFLLPLAILRYPLPAILGCLIVDAVDQTIFQSFGYDPPGYQGYDKAMDVFYLALAYLSTLRNWTNLSALRVGTFLYFYRLVGVVAFELSGWRPLLLIFPNTFEYFFIAYEALRLRQDPTRRAERFWALLAVGIWIFVKLPQEYWIHIAELDFTETVADVPWFAPAVVIAILVACVVAWAYVRPRLGPADWPWRILADPMPEEIKTAAEQSAWRAGRWRVWSWGTLEKVVLVGLLSVIFGSILPGVRATSLQVFNGIAVLIVVNAAISLWVSRAGRSIESITWSFVARVVTNMALVVVAEVLLEGGDIDARDTVFFLLMLSLMTTLHDRYLPVREYRAQHSAPAQPRTSQ